MRRLNLLVVVTAMVLVTAGSAKGNASLGPIRLDRAAVTASQQSSLPMMKSGESLSGMILSAADESTVGQLVVAATAEDGDKNPPPRSTHCPPDKDDHHDSGQKGGDNQNTDNQDKGKEKDKDKDHHDDCGKGDDGKNP
jgi:hypothetical protein